MYRIKDIEALTVPNNFYYGINLQHEDGTLEDCPEELYPEAFHRELLRIVILDEYREDNGMPQIIYVVKGEEDAVDYETELIQTLTLKEFFKLLDCVTEDRNGIIAHCNVPFDSDTLVWHFHLAADPERKEAPTIEIETANIVSQICIPDNYD